MDLYAQILVNGLALGSFYVLLALGFSLIFGMVHAFNLAHGELVLLSGYLAYGLWKFLGLPFYWTLLPCLVLLMPVSLGLERLLRRLPAPFELHSLVVTFGLAIVLQNLFLALFSADFRLVVLPPVTVWGGGGQGVLLTLNQFLLLLLSLAAVTLMHLLLHYTFVGKALRASIQNLEAAALAGIKVEQMRLLAFVLGGILIGLAGPLWAANMYLYPAGGTEATLVAIIITIVAGVGRTRQLLLCGWLLGLAEAAGIWFLGSSWRELVSAAVLLAILIWRFKDSNPA